MTKLFTQAIPPWLTTYSLFALALKINRAKLQATLQLIRKLEEVFHTEFPDKKAWRIESEESRNQNEIADWILIGTRCSEKEWNSIPLKTKILSPLLPSEFAELNTKLPLTPEINNRWYWIPPYASDSPSREQEQDSTIRYSESNTNKASPALALVAKTRGFLDRSNQRATELDDIVDSHKTNLESQKSNQLILSNVDRKGSPLRYFSTGCHYPSISSQNSFNLKEAFNLFHTEKAEFDRDLEQQKRLHPPTTLSSLLREIVHLSDATNNDVSKRNRKAWHLLALPEPRNAAPPTAVIEALNIQRTAKKRSASNTPRHSPIDQWLSSGDQLLQLFSYLSQLKTLEEDQTAFSKNLIKNLSLWLYATSYSRPWKMYFSIVEQLIPNFHQRYLEVQSETPTILLNKLRLNNDRGPGTSRIAAALSLPHAEQIQKPDGDLSEKIKHLHLKELSAKDPNLRSLVESIDFWGRTASLDECKKHIERLYEKNSSLEDLRIGLARTLAASLPVPDAISLVKADLEQQKATSFTLRSLVSIWFAAGRASDALEIIDSIYEVRPKLGGLISFLAAKTLDVAHWDLLSRIKSESCARVIQQAETLLAKEQSLEREDALTAQLAVRIALYHGQHEKALKRAKDANKEGATANNMVKEFWFFGRANDARDLLQEQAYTAINKTPHERLTSALINLSVGSKEDAENELALLYQYHSSIALSSSPIYPTNQFLLLHTLDTWNDQQETAQFWVDRSAQIDSGHEQQFRVFCENIIPMTPGLSFKNPFSTLIHSS